MALIAPLFAFIGRQVGRIVQMAFGWATVMLFGRVPQSKQLLLAGVSLAAILWVVTLVGVALPDIGTWLVAFVPAPDFIDEDWIRLAMLVLAIVLPLGVGLGGLLLMDPDDRPAGIGGKVVQVLRGYPYAAVLALVFLFLLVVAPIFKIRSMIKRWEDAHIPIVVKPGGYEQMADQLEKAVDSAGLDLARAGAPRVLEAPSKLLAAVGGASVRRLVPDRIVMLKAPSLEVTIHPSDISMVGTKDGVARARAAVASRLTDTEAYMTATKESQQIEDVLRTLHAAPDHEAAVPMLTAVDEQLARLVIPHEEWEVLYRQRLQVERDLLRTDRHPPTETDERADKPGLIGRIVEGVGSLGR